MISLIQTNNKPKTFKKTIWMRTKLLQSEVQQILSNNSMLLLHEPYTKLISISYNHETGETICEIMF